MKRHAANIVRIRSMSFLTLKVRRRIGGMYSGMPNAPEHFHSWWCVACGA